MRNILIVVDMQNDFIDGSLGTKEAQEIVTPVAGKIRNFEGDIMEHSIHMRKIIFPHRKERIFQSNIVSVEKTAGH